jgi:hypothetical protein
MAQKRRVTGVIDSIEERLPDNDRGWGKYKMYIEGLEGLQKVDVPADLNAEYDLAEGQEITIIEGPFKGWIVSPKSPTFTGEAAPEQERPAPKRKYEAPAKKNSSEGGYTPRKKEAPATPPVAETKSGNHTLWNQYQIDTRDPQMRWQTVLGIVANVHTACLEANVDPSDVLDGILADASKMQSFIDDNIG